jgi:hypothetical protein
MPHTQVLAHAREQWFLLGTRQITDRDTCRVDLPAGTTDGEQRNLLLTAVHDQCCLRARIINGVDDEIKSSRHDQFGHIIGINEFLDRRHHALRIDLRDTLLQRDHLCHTQRLRQRMQLTVHIRLRQMVEINHRDVADCAARQSLHDPGAHTTDADHADARSAEPLQAGRAVQTRDAAEATLDIHVAIDIERSSA